MGLLVAVGLISILVAVFADDGMSHRPLVGQLLLAEGLAMVVIGAVLAWTS